MRLIYLAAMGLMLGAAVAAQGQNPPDGIVQTVVFKAGSEGYAGYRIPAIVATGKGTLLAFCEGRKNDLRDHGDIDLVVKRSEDGGQTWGPLEIVYEEGETKNVTIGNPCPVIDRDSGTIWFPFCRDNDGVFVTQSADDGKTWAKPVEITASVKPKGWGWYATGPGVGIQLERGPNKGRMVIPCDHREKETADGPWLMKSHCFYSDDRGKSWVLGESVGLHTDECQAVELTDGRVLINMRNYWERTAKQKDKGGMRVIAWSTDGAASWSPLDFDKTLISPVCQASLLRYSTADELGANRLLFSNPASKTKRETMTVRMSLDEGKTWPISRVLHPGPSAYSCLVVLPDRSIGCLYERGKTKAYETITFARFPLNRLESGQDRP
jgi:sialidase-1